VLHNSIRVVSHHLPIRCRDSNKKQLFDVLYKLAAGAAQRFTYVLYKLAAIAAAGKTVLW
jgi:hypothetical protein